MNQNNYASLEAAQRLHDAGIVLETDCFWGEVAGRGWIIIAPLEYFREDVKKNGPPAPSMAEVWRELPKDTAVCKNDSETWAQVEYGYGGGGFDSKESADKTLDSTQRNTNPTDALIDLLIWVRKEGV